MDLPKSPSQINLRNPCSESVSEVFDALLLAVRLRSWKHFRESLSAGIAKIRWHQTWDRSRRKLIWKSLNGESVESGPLSMRVMHFTGNDGKPEYDIQIFQKPEATR